MPRLPWTALKTGFLMLLLAGCGGGGGGGGDGGGGGSQPPVTFTLSTTSVEVSARPGEAAPRPSVTVTVANVPPPGVWSFGMEFSDPAMGTFRK